MSDTTSSRPPAETPRPSASLLMAAPWQYALHSNTSRQSMDYRILMLKRSSRGTFSNMQAFPGGAMEKADQQNDWSLLMPSFKPLDDMDLAYRICALRETFEETGILITEPSVVGRFPLEQLANWRKQVYANPQTFLDICREHHLQPAIHRLLYFQRWITPKVEKRRFDTRFYLITLTEMESRALGVFNTPSYTTSTDLEYSSNSSSTTGRKTLEYHDGNETVASAWYTPQEAISEYLAKRISFMPPQWCMLEDLSQIPDINRIATQLNTLSVPTYSPEFHRTDGEHLYAILQDDWRHPAFQPSNTATANSNDKPIHQLNFKIDGKVARIQQRIRQMDTTPSTVTSTPTNKL
ncbi:hypothetical protein BDF22DRAFT_732362 [Syncephalis plumigaleata]|nr:hypothetical protein BDF22DRAFT_732362 [Syncephalis plumigaleata]